MIKKAATEPKAPDPKPAASASPPAQEESWNAHWNVSRRLLEMRRKLRGTKLWKTFELQRSFEAFSIHSLADEIEAVACDCGLISSFRVTEWKKHDNRTVLEGMVTFEDVDHGDVREYPGVGEAIDNGDKGLHKADSDARKIALINALNLGIGNDKEAEQGGKTEGDAMHGSMGGAPQQAASQQAKAPDDFIRKPAAPIPNGNGQAHGAPAKMYTLQQHGVKARAILGAGLLSTCWAIIQNTMSTQTLDDWEQSNLEMLVEFSKDDPATAGTLQKLVRGRRDTLREKGL